MKISIITYGYKNSDAFLEDFRAADAPNVTWHIALHSQRPAVVAVCEELASHSNVRYFPYGVNHGIARSGAKLMMDAQDFGADVIVQMCDDMLPEPGAIQRMAEMVMDCPHVSHVEGLAYVERVSRWESSGFDCVAFNVKAIEDIGYYDRNFYPMNFEDPDWRYRAKLAGWDRIENMSDAKMTHRAVNANATTPDERALRMAQFERTREYYFRKWGADQKEETLTAPFNDPKYDYRIPRECVDNPYPEYKRGDIE